MPKSPLGNLPLRSIPYNSRITSQYGSEGKNYFLVAFNPGYSLQASELNEIQELFFLNQSLNYRMLANWSQNSFPLVPFWEGLIPLDPNDVEVTSFTTSTTGAATANVTVNAGWFLWTDSESKLSFWIYLDETATGSLSTSPSGQVTQEYSEFIGFEIETQSIICCPAADCEGKDDTLRDNSSGSSLNFFTCGASRMKANFVDNTLQIRDAIASDFYPILKITVTPQSDGTYTSSITYMDDQEFRISE